MRHLRTSARIKRCSLLFAVIALGTMLPAVPALAIINGTMDGTHPSVGIVFSDNPVQEGGAFCNGVLIAPTIVLTAEGCVHRQSEANVSFQPTVVPTPKLQGDVFRHPQSSGGYGYGANGMAVVVLPEADKVEGVTPAALPTLSSLTALKRGESLTTVGQHPDNFNDPPTPRMKATVKLSAPVGKSDAFLLADGVDGGYPCADAGGGNFTDLGKGETLAAMTIYTTQFCEEKNIHLLRLDTRNSLEWLCSFPDVRTQQAACASGNLTANHDHRSKKGGHHHNDKHRR